MIETNKVNKIYIPDRGVAVALPEKCAAKSYIDPVAKQVTSNDLMESYRIGGIRSDSILAKRYPNPEVGWRYMAAVSTEWGAKLTDDAIKMGQELAEASRSMGKDQFAVVLYGSTARGLVKCPKHRDPSNIDMAIIGDFNLDERSSVLDKVRPLRESISSQILIEEKSRSCSCQGEYAGEDAHGFVTATYSKEPGSECNQTDNGFKRVGIHVMNIQAIRSDQYSGLRRIITACAYPIIEEGEMWATEEKIAIANIGFLLTYHTALQKRIAKKNNKFEEILASLG